MGFLSKRKEQDGSREIDRHPNHGALWAVEEHVPKSWFLLCSYVSLIIRKTGKIQFLPLQHHYCACTNTINQNELGIFWMEDIQNFSYYAIRSRETVFTSVVCVKHIWLSIIVITDDFWFPPNITVARKWHTVTAPAIKHLLALFFCPWSSSLAWLWWKYR